jgi:hypothetical protein
VEVADQEGLSMDFILTPPSIEDLVRLLKAWRFWVLGSLAGALLGAAIYFIAPPPYRAQATVNVDFNLEEAWPQDTDRQQFYYLERESRKLEEIAWADGTLEPVSADSGVSLTGLREDRLHLSQPAEAGWHFHADHQNPEIAQQMASVWAQTFAEEVQAGITQGNINEFLRLEVTQSAGLPLERSVSLGTYLLTGVSSFLFITVLLLMYIKPRKK